MAVAERGSLGVRMAEADVPTEWSAEPQPGMVKCASPGCPNYFVRASGRHLYCKAPGCTFRRGAPATAPVEVPADGSAAHELLRRLQEEDEAEVGPSVLVTRVRAVQTAMRAGDRDSYWGALIDVGTTAVWWADRVRSGELPQVEPERRPAAPQPQVSPVGLVQAVVASHQRTFSLAESRVELVWKVAACKEALTLAQHAGDEAAAAEAAAALGRAERSLTSVEGAWRERERTLRELEGAAAPRVAVG